MNGFDENINNNNNIVFIFLLKKPFTFQKYIELKGNVPTHLRCKVYIRFRFVILRIVDLETNNYHRKLEQKPKSRGSGFLF